MKVRLILLLALTGAAVGATTVLGIVHSGTEMVVWCVLALALAAVIAGAVPHRPFVHGFLTGFLAGILASLVQVVFFDRYLAANPTAAASFDQLPRGTSPRVVVLVLSPIVAALNGLLVGFLAWAAFRILGRSRAGGQGAAKPA